MVVPCDTVSVNHAPFQKKKEEPVLAAPAPVVEASKEAPKLIKPSKKTK